MGKNACLVPGTQCGCAGPSRPPVGPLVLRRAELLQGTERLAAAVARRPAGGAALQRGGLPGSGARRLPQSTCHPSLCIKAPPSPASLCFPPRGSPCCFSHWQMPAAFLPAVGGAGGGRASASASSALAASFIPGISQLQVLWHDDKQSGPGGEHARHLLCLTGADTPSIMVLIRPLGASRLNFGLWTEFTANWTALFPTWASSALFTRASGS